MPSHQEVTNSSIRIGCSGWQYKQWRGDFYSFRRAGSNITPRDSTPSKSTTTLYGGRYDDKTIESWAAWLRARAADGLPVYAYFNNDSGGHAPRDAVRLREAIGKRLG